MSQHRLTPFDWSTHFVTEELEQILKCTQEETHPKGAILLKEGNTCRELILLEEGEVEVLKDLGGAGGTPYVITTLKAPITLGELAFMNPGERLATVRALGTTKILRLERARLDLLPEAIRYKFLSTIGSAIIDHLRVADNRLLEEVEVRGRFGRFVVLMMLLFLLQNYMTAFISDILEVIPMYIVTLLALLFATIMCALMMRTVKQPLNYFGATLRNWRRSLLEGLGAALLVFGGLYLWIPEAFKTTLASFVLSFKGIAYLFSAFLQEFTFRGVFQTSLQTFFQDPKGYRAIPLTALAFSSAHVIHDFKLAIGSFLISLPLGALFVRHRSLIGVSLFHYALGVMAVTLGLLAP